MISSGVSMFDVIDELKKRGINKVYIVVTYALFTEEIDKFDDIYKTNLSYIPNEIKNKEWIHVSDCSEMLANITYNIHNDLSISKILKDKSEPIKLLEKKFGDKNV